MRLCWILLEDMIVEAFGDILPLNTFVHFCQTFLEGILVRHSFERVVVWKTLFWNTHWKIHSSKTLSDTSGLVATCCDLLLQSVVENPAPIVSGTFQSSKVPKCPEFWSLEIVPFQKWDPYGYSWLFTGLLRVSFALLPNMLHQKMKCLFCL